MELIASLDELLAQIPIGLEANAQDSSGAASLENALQKHSASGLLDGGIDIDQVDTDDGAKIVSNVFGDKDNQVTCALGGITGRADASLVQKVLPILAPIVMAYLAKKPTGGSGGSAGAGGGLGDLLGGILGGAGGSGGVRSRVPLSTRPILRVRPGSARRSPSCSS
nr:DUF937 domain-containing protein [Rhodococcus sp. AW25M09]